ncbi:MAG TPA: lycopene cyclase domain-containing protein [Aequorivita sp.]|jgi:lycopene cyclase domain-containing protein|nr:lycopene cyclase [Aequorivita sp.]MBP41683.1 lycopene cyclase [Aequorivita sp.]HBC03546.1 lycopene cyclase domain-containing protein [Aequorivita sp.]HNP67507.1 lycopene cyclase domain-containing protein [Aequorivita sp.]|tara:strand:+ start:639 stop:1346 length:708 start_codon:yes stop_codon:yes gene_type:complete
MWHLYLLLNLASLSIPFLFSFHPKLRFYKLWKYFFPATFIMMAFFIPWDINFTQNGIWGFNEKYLSGIKLGNLPLEEWLFFICIPYACIFTIYAFKNMLPKFSISEKTTQIVYFLLQTILIATLLYFYDRLYTAVNFGYAIVLLALVYNYKRETLQVFFPIFLILLVPFFIVNGFLTGSWIHEEVVWYNNAENLGIRIGSVPIEDSIYALTMLLTIYILMEKFKDKYSPNLEREN